MDKTEFKKAVDQLDRKKRVITKRLSGEGKYAENDLNRAINEAFATLQSLNIPDILWGGPV